MELTQEQVDAIQPLGMLGPEEQRKMAEFKADLLRERARETEPTRQALETAAFLLRLGIPLEDS